MNINYQHSALIDDQKLKQKAQKLEPEIKAIAQAIGTGYQTKYASVNMPNDKKLLEAVQTVINEKKQLEPHALVVIGIGGSHLGAAAIQEALFGRFYNEQLPDIKVYFADTVDTDYIWDIVLLVEQELEAGHNILINVISKSGNTTETLANYEIFFELIKRYKKEDYHNYVVVTTDEGSVLWHLAQQERMSCLSIPSLVGGRYSVFSAVGLFPLGMIGVDIAQLHAGAQSAIASCTDLDIYHNPAALKAALLFAHYEHGIHIHDLFLFSVDLYAVGAWYRQLVAESLGKNGKGIMPTVSIGSRDLHSIAQLYLGGPAERFTTFVNVTQNKSNLVVPDYQEFEKLVANIQGLPLSSIMQAIFYGVCAAYHKHNLPFVTITVVEKSAFYIGQLLQMMMFEVIYVGYLLEVNPFDQPEIELYKAETRRVLAERTL